MRSESLSLSFYPYYDCANRFKEDRIRQDIVKNRFNAQDIETIKVMQWLFVDDKKPLSDMVNPSVRLVR